MKNFILKNFRYANKKSVYFKKNFVRVRKHKNKHVMSFKKFKLNFITF
jgi:hypothetical protein